MRMQIDIDYATLKTLIAGRSAVRKLVMQRATYISGNVLVIRHVGQIAPYTVTGAPVLIGQYREPIAKTTLEIFQVSCLQVGEYFLYGDEKFRVEMNEVLTATDWSPAITEFVAVRD